jgi:LPXTG cell wall anchor motif
MTRARNIQAASAVQGLAWAMAAPILAAVLIPAVAAAPLESLQIEIWPEYDRPAALVILKGELAGDVGLPAAVSLRIPASSGGPTAVAYATATKGQLFNLPHDRSDAADFITLRFTVPLRLFHVEFYDRFATGASGRSYRYIWPGDVPVRSLNVVVQEPAGASDISVQPELNDRSTGSDGMQYRSAQLGAVKQGAPLSIEIRYTKTDARTSADLLALNAPAPDPQATPATGQRNSSRLFLALGAAALLVAGSGLVYYYFRWRRRARPRVGSTGGRGFCAKCGNAAAAGDRFCSKCGAALA